MPAAPIRPASSPPPWPPIPTSRFVYVTDFASNELIGYTVLSNGSLHFMVNGPFKTGNEPTAITIDPRGIYIYITNSLDNTVSAYSISLPTGTPSTIVELTASAGNATDTEPVSIIVEPALGRFVYTANYLGNSVSGFRLNPDTGALEHNTGHALSHRRESHGHRRGSARQPRRPVRHTITRPPALRNQQTPSQSAGLFAEQPPSIGLHVTGRALFPVPCVLAAPCSRSAQFPVLSIRPVPCSPFSVYRNTFVACIHSRSLRCAGFSIKCSAKIASAISST